MNRTIWIEIGEAKYPMRCTLGAMEKICEVYKSKQGFFDALKNDETVVSAVLTAVELFIAQGCAYENYFNKNLPDFPDGGYKPLPKGVLACAFAEDDFIALAQKIIECFNLSLQNSIKAKQASGKKK